MRTPSKRTTASIHMATPAFFSADKLDSYSGKIRPPELTLRQSRPANLPALRGHGQIRWRVPMIHEYAAIDPMALLFPSRIYISMSEKLHPHVPEPVGIKEAVGRLTPEGRLYILQRARMMSHYSKAVEGAVAGMKWRPVAPAEIMIGTRPGNRPRMSQEFAFRLFATD